MRAARRIAAGFHLLLAAVLLTACAAGGTGGGKGEPTAPAPQEQRKPDPYASQYPDLWRISDQGPAIPGLDQEMIPQGLAYWKEKNWLITSNYLETGDPSTLMIVDAASGQLVKRVNLRMEDGAPYRGHAGGVVVSARHLWISSSEKAYWLPLSELEAVKPDSDLRLSGAILTPTRASFTTYAEGILWVGEFFSLPDYETDPSHRLTNRQGGQYNAWVAGYRLDPATDLLPAGRQNGGNPATPDLILSIPDKIQGMAATAQRLMLSQSYGRTKDSVLLSYQRPDFAGQPHLTVNVGEQPVPVWLLDRSNQAPTFASLKLPSMSEGVVSDGGNRLFVLFESGAKKYRSGALSPMDHLRVIRLDAIEVPQRAAGLEVVAHRGGTPENSLSAFRTALATAGVGAIELDVQMTRDLVPVVIHDNKADRTTNGTGLIGNMTAAQVTALKTPKEGGTEPVPTLTQVLALLGESKGQRLFLEIKSPAPRETVPAVLSLLKQHGLAPRTVVTSFDAAIVEAVRKESPGQLTGLILSSLKDDGYAKFGGEYLLVNHTALTPQLAHQIKAAGKQLYAWTVNDEAALKRVLELKVDGVISDQYATVIKGLPGR